MFDKFARSWELVKASAEVLRSDKELLLFPLISGAATLVVLATFLIPMFALRIFDSGFGIGSALVGFAFYFCQYSVIIFFNCALVGAAMIRLRLLRAAGMTALDQSFPGAGSDGQRLHRA